MAATALAGPGCVASGVLVVTVSGTSARSGAVVVITVSATAPPFAFCGWVDGETESAAVGARLGETVASWGTAIGSETTEADSGEAAARVVPAGAGLAVC
ncbi:MAG TPA: hypothetical protein VFC01_14025, partial [Mycobacterium sp.]|nr:hypothetical protein [Mycobacterium sp.]